MYTPYTAYIISVISAMYTMYVVAISDTPYTKTKTKIKKNLFLRKIPIFVIKIFRKKKITHPQKRQDVGFVGQSLICPTNSFAREENVKSTSPEKNRKYAVSLPAHKSLKNDSITMSRTIVKTTSSKGHASKLSLRLTEEERDFLQQLADRENSTISVVVRKRILESRVDENSVQSNNGTGSRFSERDLLLLARYIRDKFRVLSPELTRTVDEIINAIKIIESSQKEIHNENAVALISRDIHQILDITSLFQKNVNELLKMVGEKEVHYFAKMDTSRIDNTVSATEERQRFLKKYTYMVRVQIIGTITTDVVQYTANNGGEKMKFTLTSEDGKQSNSFFIYSFKDETTTQIKKGMVVFVEGDLKFSEKGSAAVFANVVRIFPK